VRVRLVDDPRAEVGEEVRVGVVECQLYRAAACVLAACVRARRAATNASRSCCVFVQSLSILFHYTIQPVSLMFCGGLGKLELASAAMAISVSQLNSRHTQLNFILDTAITETEKNQKICPTSHCGKRYVVTVADGMKKK